jgi:hypothetical protein
MMQKEQPTLYEEMEKLSLEIVEQGQLNELRVKYTLAGQIRQAQIRCPEIEDVKNLMARGKAADYRLDEQDTLWLKDHICVPRNKEIRDSILKEAHDSRYSIHPGCMKMYKDLKVRFLWEKMREYIAEYVTRCDTCQRVKAEHQRPAGLLQPLETPTWKWEDISMDFIVGLPRTQKGNDSIWVVVDRLTKVAHFIPVKTTFEMHKLVKLYIDNILKLHGAPKSIVSDRGPQFTAKFWRSLHKAMGTNLHYSSAFHPHTDGQIERVNQVLEDLLRACVLTYGSDWEKSLSYAEFSCNNSYQASLKMVPFKALYGRKCRTPLMWSEVGERTFFGPATIV